MGGKEATLTLEDLLWAKVAAVMIIVMQERVYVPSLFSGFKGKV